jgi:hypothetical protein
MKGTLEEIIYLCAVCAAFYAVINRIAHDQEFINATQALCQIDDEVLMVVTAVISASRCERGDCMAPNPL